MVTRARAEYEIAAVDKIRAAINPAQRNFRNLDRSVSRVVSTLGVGLAGGALGFQIDKITASAQAMSQTVNNLNFPIEDLQRYQIAANPSPALS